MPGRIQRSIEAALNPDNERSELSGEAGHRQAVVALLVEGVLNPLDDVHAPYLSSFDP